MANKDYDKEDGVWRTIGGRRVFIRTGQSLADAMKESGKFSRVAKNQELYKKLEEEKKDGVELNEKQIEAGERLTKKAEQGAREDVSQYLRSDKTDFDNDEEFVNSLADEWGIDKKQAERLLKEGKSIEENKSPSQKLNNLIKDNNVKTFADEIKEQEKNKSFDVDMSDTTTEEYNKKSKEIGYPRSDEHGNYRLEKNGDYTYKMYDKIKELQPTETKKEKGTFTQQVDFGNTTREYNQDDLKRMESAGIKPMEHSYTGGGWEGINSDKNLDTKDQAKAITDALKKKYPDVKIARKSNLFSGGSSIDFNIMSSDKDLFVSDNDIDKMGYEDLHDVSRSNGFEWWAKDNVPNYNDNHSYNIDDVRKYAKQSLAQRKTTDIQGVKGNEWYLNDYGKKVVSDLNKEANSYTYNDSDGMIDYFDHGTYMHISIGKWNKPYQVTGNSVTSALKNKAYQKYMKEHPSSKMTLEEFKKR